LKPDYASGPTGIRTPNLRIMSTLLSRRQMKNDGVKMVAITVHKNISCFLRRTFSTNYFTRIILWMQKDLRVFCL